MASEEDLMRIGMEGFALLDAFIEKKGRAAAPRKPYVPQGPAVPQHTAQANLHQYQPQPPPLYQVKPVYANEKKNTYEVVQFLDRVSTVDYPKRKLQNPAALLH